MDEPSLSVEAVRAGLPDDGGTIHEYARSRSRYKPKKKGFKRRGGLLGRKGIKSHEKKNTHAPNKNKVVNSVTRIKDRKMEVVERVLGRVEVGRLSRPSSSGENWGLNRYGWWLLEKYVAGDLNGALSHHCVPLSMSAPQISAFPEIASRQAVSLGEGVQRAGAGPTGLSDLRIPGWGDSRIFSFVDTSCPPPRCLGLIPPSLPPPRPLALPRGLAVTVYSSRSVIVEPCTALFRERLVVAQRAVRSRIALLLSKSFCHDNEVRRLFSLREMGDGATALTVGGGNVANKRARLVELVQMGALGALKSLRMTQEELRLFGDKPTDLGGAGEDSIFTDDFKDDVELGEGGLLKSLGGGIKCLATYAVASPVIPDCTLLLPPYGTQKMTRNHSTNY